MADKNGRQTDNIDCPRDDLEANGIWDGDSKAEGSNHKEYPTILKHMCCYRKLTAYRFGDEQSRKSQKDEKRKEVKSGRKLIGLCLDGLNWYFKG